MRSVWICPSRNRPANIARLLNAWDDTRAQADLVVAVDDDDDQLPAYRELFNEVDPSQFHLVVGPRLRLGPTLNYIAPQYAGDYDAIGFLGDDHIPRTPRWDDYLGLAVHGGGLAYGNDLLQGENLATAVIQSADIVRTLNQFCPPGQTHLYLDNYWMDLGRGLGRLTYLPEVILEHAHYIVGKADHDALYQEVNAPGMYSHDGEAYARYQENQLPDDIAAVQAVWNA